MTSSRFEAKGAAAEHAVREVSDGMVIGLGSGSTAEIALELLGARIAQGLKITTIPTSERTAALARQLNIPLTDFSKHSRIDLTIDGADQVETKTLTLIKGLGGALLREKIVASASSRMIIIVDDSKIVDCLKGLVPVEVTSFGWEATRGHLTALGCTPRLRVANTGPIVTDGGNYIVDCDFAAIDDPGKLETQLLSIVGVLECGLFNGLASEVIIGSPSGIDVVKATPHEASANAERSGLSR